MIAAVLLSLVTLLPGPLADQIIPQPGDPIFVFPDGDEDVEFVPIPAPANPQLDWDLIDRNCQEDPQCRERARQLAEGLGALWGDDDAPRRRGGGTWPPPGGCTPRAPGRPKPDVKALPDRIGEIVHRAGDGVVRTGMETEFRWEGPQTVTWTQPGLPGLTADCTFVPGEPARFTATLQTMLFDFEIGKEKLHYVDVDNPRVEYTYEQEGRWTVCVYAVYEVPGEGSLLMTQVAELDHDVAPIKASLMR